MTTSATSGTAALTFTPSTILASTNDPNSTSKTAPIRSANGMAIIGGSLPDNSDRDVRRCIRLGCTSQGAKRCSRRYCKSCCQAEPLAEGTRCPYHKGTTPQQLPNRSETGETFDDQDDPLDVNVTFSRNLQREWQDVFADTSSRAFADANYRTAGQRMTRKQSHYAVIWVWYNNGQGPEPLEIDVPSWPWFHPKELSTLASEVLIVDDRYWRYNEESQRWMKTHRSFRVDGSQTLYTRAVNVTDCPGVPATDNLSVPSTPTKRPLAQTGFLDNSSSPAKFFRTVSSSNHFLLSAPAKLSSSAHPRSEIGSSTMNFLSLMSHSPSRPPAHSPSTPSSLSREVTQDAMSPVLEASFENPFIDASEIPPLTPDSAESGHIHPPSARSIPPSMYVAGQDALHTPVASEASTTRVTPPVSSSPAPSMHSSTSQTVSSPIPLSSSQDVAVLPSSESSFPLTYVCDMMPLMSEVTNPKKYSDLTVEERFVKVFAPLPFRHGTYYDARRVYLGVPTDVQACFSSKGRTPEGRWSEMVSWWNANNVDKRNKLRKSRTSTPPSTSR